MSQRYSKAPLNRWAWKERIRYPSEVSVCLFIFCAAFAVRACFYFLTGKGHGWNVGFIGINGWLDIAKNLVSGVGYSTSSLLTYFPVDHLEPTAARSPVPILVLSVLLRIFRSGYDYPLLVYSWTLSALSAAALYRLSEEILASKKLGFATAILYGFYFPEMSVSTGYATASESLFTLLLMGYFMTMIRNAETLGFFSAATAGGLLGVACLCRPVVLFFPVLYAGWVFRRHGRKALMSVVLFCAVFLTCLLPWVIRNQIVFHRPIVTTTLGGYNLLRHNGMIERNEFRLYTGEDFLPFANKLIAREGYELNRLNEAQLDSLFTREALRVIRSYPWRYLKLCAIRTVWLWYKIGGERPLYLIQNCLLYVLMFPGIILALVRRHFLRVLIYHLFYFIVAHAAVNAQFRFICPMMPYGIMIAVYAGSCFFGRSAGISDHNSLKDSA